MLDEAEVLTTVRDLWKRHRDELAMHDRTYFYVRGLYGVPDLPEGANDELKDIAKMSVKNVLSLVRDAFAQNLGVVGYRSPDATTNADVWQSWQRHRLDARQAEAHRAAITYGTSYAALLDNVVKIRSPRQLFAVYADPHVDEWPGYALETWIDYSGRKPVRRGTLIDETHTYPVTLGTISDTTQKAGLSGETQMRIVAAIDEDSEPTEHGFENPPVVRFVNALDAEDLVVGEIAPLIRKQQAINAVNFDRLVVSRYGAFPQKYAIGWAPASPTDLVKASVARLQAFEDEFVKVGAFPAASVEPYNSILGEMVADVAMTAQIPVSSLTGDLSNLAAETIAMAEAPHQRKLTEKRESFGESWEQLLRLLGVAEGVEVPDDAEVIWRTTEARSFAQVVDGITKLATSGVPIEVLLEDIPGWSQQRVDEARAAFRRQAGRGVLDQLRAAAGTPGTENGARVPSES